MSSLARTKANLEAAQADFKKAAKRTLAEVLDDAFAQHEELDAIVWGVRVSEYDDEGMEPGVHGPRLFSTDEDIDREDLWDFVFSRGPLDSSKFGDSSQIIAETLDAIGAEILTDIVGGMSQYWVFVTRNQFGPTYSINCEYAE